MICKENLSKVTCNLDDDPKAFDAIFSLLQDTNQIQIFYSTFTNDSSDFYNNIDKIPKLFKLLENSSNHLIELRINFILPNIYIIEKPDFGFEELLRKCKHLKKFQFYGGYTIFNNIEKQFNEFKNSKNCLECLNILASFDNSCSLKFLNNFKNLTILTFIPLEVDGDHSLNILKQLSNSSSSLQKLSIVSSSIQSVLDRLIIFVYKNFHSIQSLKLISVERYHEHFADEEDDDSTNFGGLKGLRKLFIGGFRLKMYNIEKLEFCLNNIEKLHEIQIDLFDIRENEIFSRKKLLKNFSHFGEKVTIFMDCFLPTNIEFEGFHRMIRDCGKISLSLQFSTLPSECENKLINVIKSSPADIVGFTFDRKSILVIKWNMEYLLTTFKIRRLLLNNCAINTRNLCNGLFNSIDSLQDFDLTNCNLKFNDGIILRDFLSNCKKLQMFCLIGNPFVSNETILNGLLHCKFSLKHLELDLNKKLSVKLFFIIAKFSNLEYLRLKYNEGMLNSDITHQLSKILPNFYFYNIDDSFKWFNIFKLFT